MLKQILHITAFAAAVASSTMAEEWPSFRGPRLDGSSIETGLPLQWSATNNVAWKVAVPGWGHSSPIVWGDRIFVTTYVEDGDKRELICFDRRNGKMLWERVVLTSPVEKKHKLNSYASSTPSTDGKHVWVSFLQAPNIVLACYDFDGKEVYRKSPGTFASKHGFCSSPVLWHDLVILNCDQDDVAYIVAFDKATGTERWRTDRPNRTRSYCTPIIVEAAGKTQMILSGNKCVASYDPANGKQHWLIDGPTEQFVAGAAMADGVVFITGGFPERHFIGIDPAGTGNITKTHILWHGGPSGVSYVPSPVAGEHRFFVVGDQGTGYASCLEAKTGNRLWQEKLGRHHSSSAVIAEGRVYFLDDDGIMWVVKAGDKFELLSKNELGEECYATPAISRGQMFIRTLHNLFCIGAGK